MVTSLNFNFDNFSKEGLHEECGVFGIYGNDAIKPSYACYNGLLALQHRGQESCGIAVSDCGVIDYHKDMGLVTEVFNNKILEIICQLIVNLFCVTAVFFSLQIYFRFLFFNIPNMEHPKHTTVVSYMWYR